MGHFTIGEKKCGEYIWEMSKGEKEGSRTKRKATNIRVEANVTFVIANTDEQAVYHIKRKSQKERSCSTINRHSLTHRIR